MQSQKRLVPRRPVCRMSDGYVHRGRSSLINWRVWIQDWGMGINRNLLRGICITVSDVDEYTGNMILEPRLVSVIHHELHLLRSIKVFFGILVHKTAALWRRGSAQTKA